MDRLVRTLIVIGILLISTIPLPVSADAPTIESWDLGASRDGTGVVTAGYFINTVNLQVDRFWLQNDSGSDRLLYIVQRGEIIFEFISLANSGYIEQEINNFKFQRLPATHPDDPNSIRFPPNTSIFVTYYE